MLAELGGGEKQRVLEFAAGFVYFILLLWDTCDEHPPFHAVILNGAKRDVWYVALAELHTSHVLLIHTRTIQELEPAPYGERIVVGIVAWLACCPSSCASHEPFLVWG